MRRKDFNSRIKVERIYIQLFIGAKANQLNHYVKPILEEYKYDCLMIHFGINDILRCKNDNEINNLSGNMLGIANSCQNLKVGKIYISVISPLKYNKINISQIMKVEKRRRSNSEKQPCFDN